MPKLPDGKSRGSWYVSQTVHRVLRLFAAGEGRRESHIVEDALVFYLAPRVDPDLAEELKEVSHAGS